MRFMHLADLHIGKKLCEYPLAQDQRHILAQIVELAKEQDVDAVLIAGDLYDKDQPSEQASSICNDFLTSLHNAGLPVYATAGNHDSAGRISFLASLLAEMGVWISKPFSGEVESYELEDEHGKIVLYLLPYITPTVARRFFPDSEIKTYDDALRTVIDSIELDDCARNILVAHQFFLGRVDAIRSESEGISIGGSDEVSASMLERFDYVALGHLHAPQWVIQGKARYGGSPLKYSFSEVSQKKSVTIVDLGEKGHINFEMLELSPLHGMREVRGNMSEIRDYAESNPESANDYIRVALTETDINAKAKLDDLFPLLASMSIETGASASAAMTAQTAEDITKADPLDIFGQLFERIQGRQMSADEIEMMREIALEVTEGGDAL